MDTIGGTTVPKTKVVMSRNENRGSGHANTGQVKVDVDADPDELPGGG
jgi:hypothetical protein